MRIAIASPSMMSGSRWGPRRTCQKGNLTGNEETVGEQADVSTEWWQEADTERLEWRGQYCQCCFLKPIHVKISDPENHMRKAV